MAIVTKCNALARVVLSYADDADDFPADTIADPTNQRGDALAVTAAGFGVLALSASTPVTIDLTNIGLTTFAGRGWRGSLDFAAVKLLKIVRLDADDAVGDGTTIVVGGAASTPFLGPLGGTTPTVTVPPGSPLLWYTRESAGWSTTGATNLKIDPGADAQSIAIMIAGVAP